MANVTTPYQPKPNLIIWRPIVGFPRYRVSDRGEVLDTHKNKRLKQSTTPIGYRFVHLNKDGKRHMKYVHRLVAEAFIPNPDGLNTVDHQDGDKTNNRVSNLQWMSATDNVNKWHAEQGHDVNRWFSGYYEGELIGRWTNQNEAARELSVGVSLINDCLHGKRKHAKHFTFSYDE